MKDPTVLIVLDGAADQPDLELGGSTPLALARTHNLDAIAQRATGGLVQVLPNHGAPQTHSGMLSLLGYPDAASHAKRGCLEGAVVFGGMRPGCLYARGNLSSLVDQRVPSRRVNRDVSQEEADAVVERLNAEVPELAGIGCRFKSYSTYRLAIEIDPGTATASEAITGTDPGYSENEFSTPQTQHDFAPSPSRPMDATIEAAWTASAVNAITEACIALLDGSTENELRMREGRLPINYVLMRDFGLALPPVQSLRARWDISAKYFHDLPVEVGVARYLGMDEEEAGCASVTHTAFQDAGQRLIRDLDRYDFICFHVKGPDEPGHDGDWRGKIRAIEIVDESLLALVAQELERRPGLRVVVTSDHATSWRVGTHTSDSVPMIVTSLAGHDDGLRLTERNCAAGTLSVSTAWTLMARLFGKDRPLP
jgi:2,3-bisphosphoglycerate-independent phosphoglycerate mutase